MPTTLIVGAGIFGASTAYHVSLDPTISPSTITVLDRTPTPPSPAASTDINKIIRADYLSPFYCDLAYEAMDAWQSWPELKDYYHRSGWVMLDNEGSDLAERIRKVFRDRGHDPTVDVPLAEIGERKNWAGVLKGTKTEGFKDAYWNPEAGWCEAGHATASVMHAAMGRGVKYVCADIEGLVLGQDGVTGVRDKSGKVYTADRIVLATGAWTSSLMSPTEDELDVPEQGRVETQASAAGVAVAHYKMDTQQMRELTDMPVVVYGDHGEVIPPPKENSLLKFTNAHTFTNTITTTSGHKISVPPNRDQHVVSQKLKNETNDMMISRVMPRFTNAGHAPVAYWRLCWDARKPSQDWLLTRHPDKRLQNLYLAIGGSFHSYKFLPTAGKYMAKVLSGQGNGEESDKAWGWKSSEFSGRGAHEKTAPMRDLSALEDEPTTKL